MSSINDLQKVQLEIAKEVKRICEKHNIQYFMIGGTMLGAIRHGGFIPWDDDLDLGFLREEYERFLAVAPQELSEAYELQTWENDAYYPYPFAKLRKKGTLFEEATASKKMQMKGVWVDLFPNDAIFKELVPAVKNMERKAIIYGSLIKMKAGLKPWKLPRGKKNHFKTAFISYVKYLPFRFLALFCSKKSLIKKYDALTQSFNGNPEYMECVVHQGPGRYGKETFCRRYFAELQDFPFEDTTFPGSAMYDEYLTTVFGDYMTPPPEAERVNYHGATKIQL